MSNAAPDILHLSIDYRGKEIPDLQLTKPGYYRQTDFEESVYKITSLW